MKPATPLPWDTLAHATMFGNGRETREQNAAYALHAANAYPKMVELLRSIHAANPTRAASVTAMLRELGEL